MQKLGNIFYTHQGVRIVLGILSADTEHGTRAPLVGLDLAAVLPVCKMVGTGVLCAACVPYENIPHPPYLCHDIMYDKTKKAQKVGWVTSTETEKGVKYLVWLDVEAIRKRWDCVFLHLHEPTPEELNARLGKGGEG